MNNKLKKDLSYGNKKEDKLLIPLEKHFNMKLTKTSSFYEFDYINEDEKVLIELKSRRNTKTQYHDTMVGYNKVKKGFQKIKEGYKVYFCFGFTDYTCCFELKEDSDISIRDGGRTDRGRAEIKKYAFIKTKDLINLF